MDRDDYFHIYEEATCHDIESFITNKEWASMAALSRDYSEREEENRSEDSPDQNESKKNIKKEKAVLKLLEYLLILTHLVEQKILNFMKKYEKKPKMPEQILPLNSHNQFTSIQMTSRIEKTIFS